MDMKKIELEIVALSHSISNNNNYAVVLGETDGSRRMAIVIGAFEAQAIAVALEKMQPSRPLTHDLFYNLISTFGIDILEVVIYKIVENIFYAKLLCLRNHEEIVEIDSRTSDALALAVRANCKIFTYYNVLDMADKSMNEANAGPKRKIIIEGEPEDTKTNTENTNKLKSLSIDQLHNLLNQVLENEDYAYAIKIRDEINSRSK